MLLDYFVADRKSTKGLTKDGEDWLRDTLGRFLKWLPVSFDVVTREHIVRFLGQYDAHPWRKHSFYRAFRTFWKWVSMTYDVPNPMIDRWGNATIDAPKTPVKVLYTMTPENVRLLINAVSSSRDKALISLLADTGARRSEITNISVWDVDVEHCRIKVLGKGNKEGYLVFGATTQRLIQEHLRESSSQRSLFGLTSQGLQSMLQRLEKRTGIKCHAHSFRRGFATELRRKGLNEMDIAELGRWSSVVMVKRYSRAYTFDDAAARYKPIVD